MVESSNTANECEEEMTYGDYFILSAREGDVEALAECLTEDVPIDY